MRKLLDNINIDDILQLKHRAGSKVKFDTILEALELLKNFDSPAFPDWVMYKGWDYVSSGMYKKCVAKKSIVLKFPLRDHLAHPNSSKEMLREYDQWKNPPDAMFKKYLPTTYALVNDNALIQDKVLNPCVKVFNATTGMMECRQHRELWNLATHYGLEDFKSNHGHTQSGRIKFFDSVWMRDREIK